MAYQFLSTPAFAELSAHRKKMQAVHMRDLFAADAQRFDNFSLEAAGLFLDFSKNILTEETLALLIQLAQEAGLKNAIEAMFSGDKINNTEQRAAWHIALRRSASESALPVTEEVDATLGKIENFVTKLHSGEWKGFTGKPIRHVINIGIGGSDLGPCMAAEALKHYHHPGIESHFVSNVDPTHLYNTLKKIDPETSLFIIESKTFTTLETKKNAEAARHWFAQFSNTPEDIGKHFVAVSTNLAEAQKFGIQPDNIFPMWDWVGGRYSLWSAIGLPIACAIGFANFRKLLDGGNTMDRHFREAEFSKNLPVLLALLSVWYSNFFDTSSHAVVAYEQYLERFASYLQQLDMESNGKVVNKAGAALGYKTGVVLWGGAGTNTQHSFHQLFHQGSIVIPVDFLVGINSLNPLQDQQLHLYSNCLSQSLAMMNGKQYDEVVAELRQQGLSEAQIQTLAPHKVIPGNKPSNTIVYEKLTPEVLGALIALYEHKIFVQSVIWDINAYDQWGVELGKQISTRATQALQGAEPTFDSSTNGLVKRFLRFKV